MSVLEMVLKDLKAQGASDAEIEKVMNGMIEDENWRLWLRTSRG